MTILMEIVDSLSESFEKVELLPVTDERQVLLDLLNTQILMARVLVDHINREVS